jgi:hypothetical protein
MLLRLRGDLLAAIEGAVTRLGTVKASLDSALAPAADRFASAVLTDAHQAEEHVAAVEEAAAAAWANAEAAEERTQRAERLLETLEQRVVAQAGLVAALLRRASDRSDRSPDALSTRRMGKRAGDADAKVDGAEVEDAEEKALEPMSPSPVGVLDHTLITSPFAAAARRLSAAFTPAAISMVRVSSVTRSLKGVIGVSFGACDDDDGLTGRAGGGECGGKQRLARAAGFPSGRMGMVRRQRSATYHAGAAESARWVRGNTQHQGKWSARTRWPSV